MTPIEKVNKVISLIHPKWFEAFYTLLNKKSPVTHREGDISDLVVCPNCGEELHDYHSENNPNCSFEMQENFINTIKETGCSQLIDKDKQSYEPQFSYYTFNIATLWHYFSIGFENFDDDFKQHWINTLQDDVLNGNMFALLMMEIYHKVQK